MQPASGFVQPASTTPYWVPKESGPRRTVQGPAHISPPHSTYFTQPRLERDVPAWAQRSSNAPPHASTSSTTVYPSHTYIQTMDLFGNPIKPQVDHFARLPAELRNEIYHQVLFCDRKTFDIREPFPPITRVCKQMRAESMPLFLGTGKFHAAVVDRKTGYLPSWLEIMSGLDNSMKRAFGHLHISCKGGLLEEQTISTCSRATGRSVQFFPDFDRWNRLITCIKHAGLSASQFTIESFFIEDFKDCVERMKRPRLPALVYESVDEVVRRRGVQPYLFSRFVVPSLLRIHGLLDARAPPPDVLDFLLGTQEFQDEKYRAALEDVIVGAARRCKIPPEFWFEQWAMNSAATLTIRSSVRQEISRLTEERIQMRGTGLAGGHLGLAKYSGPAMDFVRSRMRECEVSEMEKMERSLEEAEEEAKRWSEEEEELEEDEYEAEEDDEDS